MRAGAPLRRGEVLLQERVAFLSSRRAYPHRPGSVDVRETHMAWLFFAGPWVYKLKKPATDPLRDGRQLLAREWLCREEVRLNRRLAGDVYRGVAALCRTPAGGFTLQGKGEAVDWLVVMARLPADLMLDRCLEQDAATPAAIDRVADRLIGFYQRLPPDPISPERYIRQFRREQAINREVLCDSRFSLPQVPRDGALALVDRVLLHGQALLAERARTGRIVEGHGDLRPEHVCLASCPVVIDCLEFNADLRRVDPFDELVYLGLECEQQGAAWVGEQLLQRAIRGLHDQPDPRLLVFYRAYRACLRARLVLARLDERGPGEWARWHALACRYLQLVDPTVTPVRKAGP